MSINKKLDGRRKVSKGNNKKEVNSVSYTKAGLLNKSKKESGDKGKSGSDEPKEADLSEDMPKISKEKSTERDGDRPIH
jgi:hypothetical protein